MKVVKYYHINESAARSAHEMNHMRAYIDGEATRSYQSYVDKAYALGEERKEKYPDEADRIDYLCDKYAKKLAEWYNVDFRIESMCPSVLISGASNFPVHKKEKQNSRRASHADEWHDIQKILSRISSCGSDAIKSNDERAIEKLKTKLEKCMDTQEKMKAVNAYYRKHKTLDDCPHLTPGEIDQLKSFIVSEFCFEDKPFPTYELSNNNANIHRLQDRLKKLEAIKQAGTQQHSDEEIGIEGLKIVENAEAMRIQLIFDGKPDEEIRSILKHRGFRWSPRFSAWQRDLNENGKFAARRAVEEIKAAQSQ